MRAHSHWSAKITAPGILTDAVEAIKHSYSGMNVSYNVAQYSVNKRGLIKKYLTNLDKRVNHTERLVIAYHYFGRSLGIHLLKFAKKWHDEAHNKAPVTVLNWFEKIVELVQD